MATREDQVGNVSRFSEFAQSPTAARPQPEIPSPLRPGAATPPVSPGVGASPTPPSTVQPLSALTSPTVTPGAPGAQQPAGSTLPAIQPALQTVANTLPPPVPPQQGGAPSPFDLSGLSLSGADMSGAQEILSRFGIEGGLDINNEEDLQRLVALSGQIGSQGTTGLNARAGQQLLQNAVFELGGAAPGKPVPPEVRRALDVLRSQGALGASEEQIARASGGLAGSGGGGTPGLQGGGPVPQQGVGAFQDLQGSTVAGGTGNTLNQNIATGGTLGRLNQLVGGATERVAGGPDRQTLASQAFNRLRAETDPAFQAELRGVGQRAAALGRVGAGLTTSDLGTVQQRREEFLGRAQESLADRAAGQELNDRVVSLNALLGSRGQTFNQAFQQDRARTGDLQQQQGFQFGQQRAAVQDAIQQFLLQQGEQQRQFGNELALGQFNLQGLQAFGNPQQQVDPQTIAVLQSLAQIQAS